jgi:hypothetical protein
MTLEPFTFVLLVIGWWIWNRCEDAWAFARREESPRITRRRARQKLHPPVIRQAIAGRIADRIAHPPQTRVIRQVREYLAALAADAVSDMLANHHTNRADRNDGTDDTPVLVARPCPGGCGRLVTHDDLCRACSRATQPEEAPAYYCVAGCGTPVSQPDYVCGKACADVVNAQPPEAPDPAPQPVPSKPLCRTCRVAQVYRLGDECFHCMTPPPDQTPEPAPAPNAHQEGPSMTQIISSEVGSPREAVEWCDGNLDINDAAAEAISVAIENLRSRGIGEEFLAVMAGALPAMEQAGAAVANARGEYIEFCLLQERVMAEPALAAALVGFLSADRA